MNNPLSVYDRDTLWTIHFNSKVGILSFIYSFCIIFALDLDGCGDAGAESCSSGGEPTDPAPLVDR